MLNSVKLDGRKFYAKIRIWPYLDRIKLTTQSPSKFHDNILCKTPWFRTTMLLSVVVRLKEYACLSSFYLNFIKPNLPLFLINWRELQHRSFGARGIQARSHFQYFLDRVRFICVLSKNVSFSLFFFSFLWYHVLLSMLSGSLNWVSRTNINVTQFFFWRGGVSLSFKFWGSEHLKLSFCPFIFCPSCCHFLINSCLLLLSPLLQFFVPGHVLLTVFWCPSDP